MEELQYKGFGQQVSAKGLHLNTMLTLLVLVASVATTVLMWTHITGAERRADYLGVALKEQTAAMKESTAVQREQNCLSMFEIKDRLGRSAECKAQPR